MCCNLIQSIGHIAFLPMFIEEPSAWESAPFTSQEGKGKLHQQFEMYKEQVKKMGEESQQQQEQKGDAPTCGICHKTKFADGCGHNCSYCQTKFCARCGGRVSLRSNKNYFLPELMEVVRTLKKMVLADLNFAKATLSRVTQDFMPTMATMGPYQHVIGPIHVNGHAVDLSFLTGQEDGED
ncbi:Regulating synaptic membrane exocytosis protein 2 [Varanus komodoensis]|nr:Regulating synaptic membrane exocytosis protein 2 [Varanus komodoensis]